MVAYPVLTAILLITLSLAVILLYYCLQNLERRGISALAVLFLGVGIWVVSEVIQTQTGPDPAAWGGMAFRLLGIEVACIGILLLGLQYTGRDKYITRPLLGLLAIEPLFVIGLSVSPYQSLLFGIEETASSPWGYDVIHTPLWMGHVLYSYLLVLIGLGLLAHMMIQAEYGYRRQIFALMIAIGIPLFVNAIFHMGVTQSDLTPISFVATAGILLYATVRLRLMDALPVARRTVLDEMEDMVILLDERGYITSVNGEVGDFLGKDVDITGKSIDAIFDDHSLGDPTVKEMTKEITVTADGEQRQLNVNKTLLTDYRDNILGQLLVCRDVTQQRRQKNQIELLKDVQSRFLRHNLRNELNTIQAHAEFMVDDKGPQPEESRDVIMQTTNRLLEWGEKARTIERLVDATDRAYVDVNRNLELVVDDMRETHPDVSFHTNLNNEQAWIVAVPQIDQAFENLVDNAARYNTSSDPWVQITTVATETSVEIQITDNGPGVTEAELEVVEQGAETQLKHSSGFGLWLVHWVIENSGGEISFDTDEDGTTVTLTFETATQPTNEGESSVLDSDRAIQGFETSR